MDNDILVSLVALVVSLIIGIIFTIMYQANKDSNPVYAEGAYTASSIFIIISGISGLAFLILYYRKPKPSYEEGKPFITTR